MANVGRHARAHRGPDAAPVHRDTEAIPAEIVCAILEHVPSLWLPVAGHVSTLWHDCALSVARGRRHRGRCRVRLHPTEYSCHAPDPDRDVAPWGPNMWNMVFHLTSRATSLADRANNGVVLDGSDIHRATAVSRPTDGPRLTVSLDLMDAAAAGNHLAVIEWMRSTLGMPWSRHVFISAAMSGNKPLMDALIRDHHPERDYRAHHLDVAAAFMCGGFQMAKRVHARQRAQYDTACTDQHRKTPESMWSKASMVIATAMGNVHGVRQLASLGCPKSECAVITAALLKRPDLVRAMDLFADRYTMQRVRALDKTSTRGCMLVPLALVRKHGSCGPALAADLLDAMIANPKAPKEWDMGPLASEIRIIAYGNDPDVSFREFKECVYADCRPISRGAQRSCLDRRFGTTM